MPEQQDVPSVSVDELRGMLDRGDPVTVLDIRRPDARSEWAVPGSVHVDAMDALRGGHPEVLDQVPLPDGRPVVAVCNSGNTSRIAAAYLRSRGRDAFSLAGGMRAWSVAWNVAEVSLPRDSERADDVAVLQVRRTGKGCLSYLVGSAGEAAAIDPSLDAELYLELAQHAGWRIVQVLETHVHADHLSRARALAEQAGAALRLPAQDRVSFPFEPVTDGQEIRIGRTRLTALRVPGHTGESTAYVLEGRAVFTGDTLFAQSVGRPDLEGGAAEARERTRELYRSVQRLLQLPPTVLVLAGHTSRPIAFDGQTIASALREVRRHVEALGADEAAFADAVVARIPPTPPNHLRILELNEAGLLPDGDPADLEAGANRCAVG